MRQCWCHSSGLKGPGYTQDISDAKGVLLGTMKVISCVLLSMLGRCCDIN